MDGRSFVSQQNIDDDDFEEDDFWVSPADFTEIPQEFDSIFEEGPFVKCVACGSALLDCDYYTIQSAKRGREVVFEMAVCATCSLKQSEEFSKESRKYMQKQITAMWKTNHKGLACDACGKLVSDLTGYNRIGMCTLDKLFMHMVMCDKCADRFNEGLSKKTREKQADFVRDNVPGVPADLDLKPIGIV